MSCIQLLQKTSTVTTADFTVDMSLEAKAVSVLMVSSGSHVVINDLIQQFFLANEERDVSG